MTTKRSNISERQLSTIAIGGQNDNNNQDNGDEII